MSVPVTDALRGHSFDARIDKAAVYVQINQSDAFG